jgi:hypothetical protein
MDDPHVCRLDTAKPLQSVDSICPQLNRSIRGREPKARPTLIGHFYCRGIDHLAIVQHGFHSLATPALR